MSVLSIVFHSGWGGPLSATAVLRFAWVVIGGPGGLRVRAACAHTRAQADVCTGARCVAGLKFFVSCPGK